MRTFAAQSKGVSGSRRFSRVTVSAVAMAAAALISLPVQAEKRDVVIKATPEIKRSDNPVTLLVSLRRQRVRVFDGWNEITSSRISSGQPGFDTPTGVFSILEKHRYHESNIYDGAPMPFMQRITWSGIALHAGIVPGYRASHGCIRLPHSFAKSLFDKTKVGARVIVTQDDATFVRFEYDRLFKPLPAGIPADSKNAVVADTRLALNDTKVDGGGTASALNPITPAMAEVAPPQLSQKPRTRAEAAQMLQDKLSKLQNEMKTAEQQKVDASEKAKSALKAAQDAETKYTSVRQPFETVLRTAADAEAARTSAIQRYRAFMGSLKPAGDEKGRLKQEDMELELEDRILDATIEAEAAKDQAAAAELAIAEVKSAFTAAKTAKEKVIEEVRTAVAQLRSAQTALIETQKDMARRDKQLSVFISLKTQRLYIRQGFDPILEVPVEVDENPGSIGTHVLTAMDYDASGDKFSWRLVTAQGARPAGETNDAGKKRKRETGGAGLNSAINQEAVRVALDAVKIPQEVQDKIAELAKPGMSLIISDRDLGRETGKGTEFVILTR